MNPHSVTPWHTLSWQRFKVKDQKGVLRSQWILTTQQSFSSLEPLPSFSPTRPWWVPRKRHQGRAVGNLPSYHLLKGTALSQECPSKTDIYFQDSEAPLPQLALSLLTLAALPAHTGSQDSFPWVRGQTLRHGSVVAKVHTQLCNQIKRKCKRKCLRLRKEAHSPVSGHAHSYPDCTKLVDLGWTVLVLSRSPKETNVPHVHH